MTPIRVAMVAAAAALLAAATVPATPSPRHAGAHAVFRQPDALTFGAAVAPPPAPAAEPEAPAPLAGGAARWLFYAGLAGLMGCAWVWTQALPGAAERSWRAPWLAWAAAALGVVGMEEAQRAAAGVGFPQFLSTWLGWTLAWRGVLVLAAASSLLLGARLSGSHRRAALIAAGCCAALAVIPHVAAGHAAAAGSWRWVAVAIQWLHFSAVGAWLGGLGALLIVIGSTPSDDRAAAVQRFSSVSAVLIGLVAVTGTVLAAQEIRTWDRLWATSYGRLVILKIGLLVILAELAVANRHRSLPQAPRTFSGLWRIGAGEIAVAALAFAVVAVLTQTAPAIVAQVPDSMPGAVIATGNDFATSMRARLEISPGYPGLNRFAVTLRDYDTGYPVVADRVSLRFRSAGRPDLAASTLRMVRQRRDQSFRAQGTNLSLDGRWIVVARVERGVNSVEVPLVVTVRSQPQKVRTIEAPGQPTLYSVQLPGGVVLDSYLDPERPGFNEIHATFISVAGQEFPISGLATIVVSRHGHGRVSLPVRRSSPGHFIGEATLTQGTWDVDVTAPTADGQVLKAHFKVKV